MPRRGSTGLTDAELRLMEVLWSKRAGTVADVANALPKTLPLAYSTVLTTLRILENKGYLRHRQEGRAFVYEPVIGREQATQNAVSHLVRRFFAGSRDQLMLKLLEERGIESRELKRLQRLIQEDKS